MVGVRSLPLLLCLAFACASNPRVTVKTQVSVTIDPAPRELPYDPRAARLVSAYRQLTDIAEHPIELALDAAVVPEFRSSFEEALIDAFTSMARDLDELKRADDAAFKFGVARLDRVEVRYDGASREDDFKLDVTTRALVIRGPAARRALVGRGIVYDVLRRAYDQDETQRYGGLTPDTVPREQRLEYFRWLVDEALVRRGSRAKGTNSQYPEAEKTIKVLRLWQLNRGQDPVLAEKAQSWLVSQGSNFTQEYVHRAKIVMTLPPNSVFNQAASAWAKWVISVYPTLEDETRVRLAKDLFVRSFTTDRPLTHRSYPPFAWPGADLFELGLAEVDRWRASGHPTQLTKPTCSSAMDFFVCTRVIEPGTHASIGPHCDEDWYRYTFETLANRKRLVKAMTLRHDPIFTETVFENVASSVSSTTARPLDVMLVLLRDLESDPGNWAIGWRVIADQYVDTSFDLGVLEETRRLWVAYPERRGLLLSGLAHMDRGEHGNVDWKGFASAFGSPISAAEFADYLRVDPAALYDAYLVWPALSRGWSRAALIVPGLDAWRANADARKYYAQDSYQSLQHVVGELCREKNTKDLALMKGYFETHKQTYSGLIDATREKECQPPPAAPPPRNEVILSPLKQGLPPLRIIQTGAE